MAQSFAEYYGARFPAETTVLLTTTYGPNFGEPGGAGELTGNVRLPAVNVVQEGYVYGPNDSLTGTLDVGGGVVTPMPEDVREGVNYGSGSALVGVLNIPEESVVLFGHRYGANSVEFTGEYQPTLAGNAQTGIDTLVIGDDYTAANNRRLQFQVALPVAPVSSVLRFTRRVLGETRDCYESTDFEIVDDGGGLYTIYHSIDGADTDELTPGEYMWQLIITDAGDEQITPLYGVCCARVSWIGLGACA